MNFLKDWFGKNFIFFSSISSDSPFQETHNDIYISTKIFFVTSTAVSLLYALLKHPPLPTSRRLFEKTSVVFTEANHSSFSSKIWHISCKKWLKEPQNLINDKSINMGEVSLPRLPGSARIII